MEIKIKHVKYTLIALILIIVSFNICSKVLNRNAIVESNFKKEVWPFNKKKLFVIDDKHGKYGIVKIMGCGLCEDRKLSKCYAFSDQAIISMSKQICSFRQKEGLVCVDRASNRSDGMPYVWDHYLSILKTKPMDSGIGADLDLSALFVVDGDIGEIKEYIRKKGLCKNP